MSKLAPPVPDLTGAQAATGEAGGSDLTPANPQHGSGGLPYVPWSPPDGQGMQVPPPEPFLAGSIQPQDGVQSRRYNVLKQHVPPQDRHVQPASAPIQVGGSVGGRGSCGIAS